jgi:hypothetical protein
LDRRDQGRGRGRERRRLSADVGEAILGQVDADTIGCREVVGGEREASICIVGEGLRWVMGRQQAMTWKKTGIKQGETHRKNSTNAVVGRWIRFWTDTIARDGYKRRCRRTCESMQRGKTGRVGRAGSVGLRCWRGRLKCFRTGTSVARGG